MSIDGLEVMPCLTCRRDTVHTTYWDAERPNTLETACFEHGEVSRFDLVQLFPLGEALDADPALLVPHSLYA